MDGLHNIAKRADSGIGNLVNNVEERLPHDSSDADWLIPLAILIAIFVIIIIAVWCVRWCMSHKKLCDKKYKGLQNKAAPAEFV